MYNHAESSKGGTKKFLPPLQGENNGIIVYDRTTYPDYLRFFFVKTPKGYIGDKQYKDGYYNGNRRELLRILRNWRLGIISSERLQYVSKDLFYLWYHHQNDFEAEYGEKYFTWTAEDFEEIPI